MSDGRKILKRGPAVEAIPARLRLHRTVLKASGRALRRPFDGAPPAFDRRMAALALIALVLAAAAAPFDAQASRWASASPIPAVRLLAAYTDVGKSTVYLVTSLCTALCLTFFSWRGRPLSEKARLGLVYSQALFAFWAVALSGIAANALKLLFGRARPTQLDALGPYSFFSRWGVGYDFTSFPSGHATTMGALAAVLGLWFPQLRLLTFPFCLAIAASRVAAGAHYPSDVIAGFSLGFLCSVCLARLLARRHSAFRFSGGRLFPIAQFSAAFSGYRRVKS